MIFRRKLYNKMLSWKKRNGSTALLIMGARRVGKSTLVKNFASREYKSYILIDFGNVSKEVAGLFEDMMSLDFFFMRLQQVFNVKLHERESVIIFDEVQRQPLARQAIKYLVADGRYDYIETGSLISIRKNVKDIVIPSEETRITLHPLDFEEALWAKGDEVTMPLLRDFFERRAPLGQAAHRKMMREFRLYMLVGGMPQAVNCLLETNNLSDVDDVKREIIDLYEDDFMKFDATGRASRIFDAIPSQLSSNSRRFKVAGVLENSRIERIYEIVAELESSKTLTVAYHCDDPSAGMSLHKNTSLFKLFVADTGLFVTLAFKDRDLTDNDIYKKLLSDKLRANLGYVYENVVAQMLTASGHNLYYHTFPAKASRHNYEVDFLIAEGTKVSPIEVKSSGYKTHASLDAFCEKFSQKIASRYLLYTKDLHFENGITYLPVYMTSLLTEQGVTR